VDELIPAKFIVRRALGPEAPLVLNADDPGVVRYASGLDNRIHWFSLEPDNPSVLEALQLGGSACYLDGERLYYADAEGRREMACVADIPATLGGAALYNVANALAAASVALALDLPDRAIRQGLAAFRGDEKDNPGRGNWFEHNGVRILVDFAHNEHGMRALADTVMRVPAERVTLLIGQAGDRLDKDIRDMVRTACSVRPDRLLVAALPGYERGRALFDVPHLIRDFALESGVAESAIEIHPSPQDATREALYQARPGDLLVLLVLTQRHEALKLVHQFIGDSV
jgi:UDP-N-acetylmuramyl tripeptide synthase